MTNTMTGKRKPAQGWQIQLGELYWRRFTTERPTSEGLQLLGSVQRGAQKGALAVSNDGQTYYQINGDYLTPLSPAQLKRAVQIATAALHTGVAPLGAGASAVRSSTTPSWSLPHNPQAHRPRSAASPVVVVVKRRRVVSEPI
jgi:hypothetical protein